MAPFVLLFLIVFLVGCAKQENASAPSAPQVPPETQADAGVIVTNVARQKGIRLEDYQEPTVTFNSSKREWDFFYTLKPPGMPGGHFSIIVDETGNTQHMGGM